MKLCSPLIGFSVIPDLVAALLIKPLESAQPGSKLIKGSPQAVCVLPHLSSSAERCAQQPSQAMEALVSQDVLSRLVGHLEERASRDSVDGPIEGLSE